MTLRDSLRALEKNDGERLSQGLFRLASKWGAKNIEETAEFLVDLARDVQTQELGYMYEIQRLNFLRQHQVKPFDLEMPDEKGRIAHIFAGLSELSDFDILRYAQDNPDAKSFVAGAKAHYLLFGRKEGRSAYRVNGEPLGLGKAISRMLGHSTCFMPSTIPQAYRKDALKVIGSYNPRISVIIPTWNRKDQVSDAIYSAYLQSVRPHELILVDDGSEDNTVNIVRQKFKEIIEDGTLKIFSRPHLGVSATRNYALAQATGDVIAYLDSDNRWEQDHLLYAVAGLCLMGSNGLVYTGQVRHNLTDGYSDVMYRSFDQGLLAKENYIDLNTIVHYRQAYDDLGGFDENMTRLVDWDLILRYSEHLQLASMPTLTSHYMLEKSVLKNISFIEDYEHNLHSMKLKQAGDDQ